MTNAARIRLVRVPGVDRDGPWPATARLARLRNAAIGRQAHQDSRQQRGAYTQRDHAPVERSRPGSAAGLASCDTARSSPEVREQPGRAIADDSVRMRFSVTSSRATRLRFAPSITRTASSCSRADARTSTSVATLTIASSRTSATPAGEQPYLLAGATDDGFTQRLRRQLRGAVPKVGPERKDLRADAREVGRRRLDRHAGLEPADATEPERTATQDRAKLERGPDL